MAYRLAMSHLNLPYLFRHRTAQQLRSQPDLGQVFQQFSFASLWFRS